MQREIKFEYIYSNGKDFVKKSFTLDEISNGDCYEFMSDMPMYKDYKLLTYRQYTGLKDKNGAEICEGDIIQNWRKSGKHEGIYVVFYDEMKAGFFCQVSHCMNSDFIKHIWGSNRGQFINGPKKIVIGNIYENKNILIK